AMLPGLNSKATLVAVGRISRTSSSRFGKSSWVLCRTWGLAPPPYARAGHQKARRCAVGFVPRSLRFDAGGLDHLGPLLGIFGDDRAEVGGRAGTHGPTKVGKPCLDFGIGEARVDLFVELVDDLCRRIPGSTDPLPTGSLVARNEVAHRRDVWQHIHTRC